MNCDMLNVSEERSAVKLLFRISKLEDFFQKIIGNVKIIKDKERKDLEESFFPSSSHPRLL